MIVYHGTTDECLEGITREGLRPWTYVARNPELALEYAWLRAMTLGSESTAIFTLDVPDSAVVEAKSWWWAQDQLQLPAGCPASCIVSVDTSDQRPVKAG
ncbi:MAG: hypothetical protein QOF77_10 [Solirubrobacteraceae bacterium]|jgi:RNA:NAD 2'-phosphotransferase (TPT1/KptA family)|nr:hypothetical protein [Solirubrobacteraceae bacterium]